MVVKLLSRNIPRLFNRIRLKQEENLLKFFRKRNEKLADKTNSLIKEGNWFFCEQRREDGFLRKKLNNGKNKL